MNAVKQRLEHFAATLGLSMLQFEKQCDMKHGVASRITAKSYPKTFEKIHQRFPSLNIEWLKTGNGDMLITEHPDITDGGVINANGGISHSAINSGSGSASYHATTNNTSASNQQIRLLSKRIDALIAQNKEKDTQIGRLLEIIEGFAGVVNRFKPRAEEEKQKKKEICEQMRQYRAEKKNEKQGEAK